MGSPPAWPVVVTRRCKRVLHTLRASGSLIHLRYCETEGGLQESMCRHFRCKSAIACPRVCLWLGNHSPARRSQGAVSSNGLVQGRTCFHVFRLKRFFYLFPGLYSAVSQTHRNVHCSSVKHHFWKYWGYLQVPEEVSEGSWETVQQRRTSSKWNRVMFSSTCMLQKSILFMKLTKYKKNAKLPW